MSAGRNFRLDPTVTINHNPWSDIVGYINDGHYGASFVIDVAICFDASPTPGRILSESEYQSPEPVASCCSGIVPGSPLWSLDTRA